MAFRFKTKQRATSTCPHTDQVKIEVAGLSRSVCESCGRVSVEYVGDAYPPEWVEMEREATTSAGSSDR
jgi:hypothetical protein